MHLSKIIFIHLKTNIINYNMYKLIRVISPIFVNNRIINSKIGVYYMTMMIRDDIENKLLFKNK